MHPKILFGKWRPFCLGLNVLKLSSSEMARNLIVQFVKLFSWKFENVINHTIPKYKKRLSHMFLLMFENEEIHLQMLVKLCESTESVLAWLWSQTPEVGLQLKCHQPILQGILKYCQISNISGTNSQIINVCGLFLQLPLCNILKPGVYVENEEVVRWCSNYIWVINNFNAY